MSHLPRPRAELDGALAVLDGLSPFGKPTFAVEHTDKPGPLYALYFGTRRYMLWREQDGQRELVKATEGHLSGVYLDTTGTGERLADGRLRSTAEIVGALVEAGLKHDALGGVFPNFPEHANRLAVRPCRVTSPDELRRLPAALDLAPFSPYLRAEAAEWNSKVVPVGVYHQDPERWPEGPWFDQRTGIPLPSGVRLRTLADVAIAWALVEDMTTTPAVPGDGSPWERGPRVPKHVRSDPSQVSLVGSEGRVLVGRLADPLARPGDLQAIYTEADLWPTALLLLRQMGSAAVAARSDLRGPTVRHAINGQRSPSPANRTALIEVALAVADELLGPSAPTDPTGKLGAALECLGDGGLRNCVGCGKTLWGRQRKWCGDACRKRIERDGSVASKVVTYDDRPPPDLDLPLGLENPPSCPRCGAILAGRAVESHRCGGR